MSEQQSSLTTDESEYILPKQSLETNNSTKSEGSLWSQFLQPVLYQ